MYIVVRCKARAEFPINETFTDDSFNLKIHINEVNFRAMQRITLEITIYLIDIPIYMAPVFHKLECRARNRYSGFSTGLFPKMVPYFTYSK